MTGISDSEFVRGFIAAFVIMPMLILGGALLRHYLMQRRDEALRRRRYMDEWMRKENEK